MVHDSVIFSLPMCIDAGSETSEGLSRNSPNFSTPFALLVIIHQNFPLINFPVHGIYMYTGINTYSCLICEQRFEVSKICG